MELFPDRLLDDLARLPGAGHSYLKQVCAPDGAEVRASLERRVRGLADGVRERVVGLLASLDNRRFFQGFAEVAALSVLERGGWTPSGLVRPGARIALAGADGAVAHAAVLAFLHQTRPGGEEDTRARLADALSRVAGKPRFVALIRRWLPHDFDPEPVRRAVEMWLQQVQAGHWDGRYAAYDDEHISLEFCLTGERARGRATALASVMGPFVAHRTLEVVEPRVVQELDRIAAAGPRDVPVVLVCVSDQAWAITDGWVRDFLYGRPRRMSFGDGPPEIEVGGATGPCVFRDPQYAFLGGVLLVDREPVSASRVRARAFVNPWAATPLAGAAFGAPALAPVARSADDPDGHVLRWTTHLATVDL